MHSADLPNLIDSFEPVFHIDNDKRTVVVYGTSFYEKFHYYFCSSKKEHYFGKSMTLNPKDAVEMTREEEEKLFTELLSLWHHDKDTVAQLTVMQNNARLYWKQKDKQEELRQLKEQKKTAETKPVIHSHQKETLRKIHHVNEMLNKYESIAPVYLNNEKTQIAAKFKNEYIFISLDEKKPYFLKVSFKGSKPMDLFEVADFIMFSGESERVGDTIVQNLTKGFQAYQQAGSPIPHHEYAITLHNKVQETLFRRMSQFDTLERYQISVRAGRSK